MKKCRALRALLLEGALQDRLRAERLMKTFRARARGARRRRRSACRQLFRLRGSRQSALRYSGEPAGRYEKVAARGCECDGRRQVDAKARRTRTRRQPGRRGKCRGKRSPAEPRARGSEVTSGLNFSDTCRRDCGNRIQTRHHSPCCALHRGEDQGKFARKFHKFVRCSKVK